MNRKHSIAAIVLMLITIFSVIGCSKDDPSNDQIALNANLDHIVPFSFREDLTDFATSAEGVIFVYGEPGENQHARIVSTFFISPNNRYGFSFELPEGMHLKAVDWDYPSSSDNSCIDISRLSSPPAVTIIWVANAPHLGLAATGGGSGTLVVDFDFNEDDCIGESGTCITITSNNDKVDNSALPSALVDLKV
jgi:hypothetical protein